MIWFPRLYVFRVESEIDNLLEKPIEFFGSCEQEQVEDSAEIFCNMGVSTVLGSADVRSIDMFLYYLVWLH